MLKDVYGDEAYCAVATDVLTAALGDFGMSVVVEFGERSSGDHAWLCYEIDSDGGKVDRTVRTAVDHLAIHDPNGILQERGNALAITVYALEVSSEASLEIIGEDSKVKLVSPWLADHAVARARFSYRRS